MMKIYMYNLNFHFIIIPNYNANFNTAFVYKNLKDYYIKKKLKIEL